MRKLLRIATLAFFAWGFGQVFLPNVVDAATQTPTVAVVFLGSFEYQQRDYYEIAADALRKKFPATDFKFVIGDHPQHVFNRYSDKQGLTPGEIPPEEKLIDFAWIHSFDRVLFLLMTAPTIKSNDITIQWENAEVTLTARALVFNSRQRLKLTDAVTTQTIRRYHRNAAKKAAFQKTLELLRDQIKLR